MKKLSRIARVGVFAVICTFILLIFPLQIFADGESQCAVCHTSARSLIKITRVIDEERSDEPTESLESVGEG